MQQYAIKVHQPLCDFYLTSLPAGFLLKTCFIKPHIRYAKNEDGSVDDDGSQRRRNESRVQSVAAYLKTQDAILPGTIILAANYTEDGAFVGVDENENPVAKRWTVTPTFKDDKLYLLKIPEHEKLAAVVDGQHRLGGFEYQEDPRLLEIELPCAVFLDLPIPQQATVFATINFNQKPVSKSQTYELFGCNLDNEPAQTWTPDKFSVFLSRKLNADNSSPFKDHIKIAAIDQTVERSSLRDDEQWTVSTATVVEGILSLISNKPQHDRDIMHQCPLKNRNRSVLIPVKDGRDIPPLRGFYLDNSDALIYKIILNYFMACEILFNGSGNKQFKIFHKTAGVHALFRVLRLLLPDAIEKGDVSQAMWEECLARAVCLDFDNAIVNGSSGAHVSKIRDALLIASGRDLKLTDPSFVSFCKPLRTL